jgi:hypothetical protein
MVERSMVLKVAGSSGSGSALVWMVVMDGVSLLIKRELH